jgi:hypothetical protein
MADSMLNVEKVLNPPQNPVINNNLHKEGLLVLEISGIQRTIRRHAVIFAQNVAIGNLIQFIKFQSSEIA